MEKEGSCMKRVAMEFLWILRERKVEEEKTKGF